MIHDNEMVYGWCISCHCEESIVGDERAEPDAWWCPPCGGRLVGTHSPVRNGERFTFMASLWDIDKARCMMTDSEPNGLLSLANAPQWFGKLHPDEFEQCCRADGLVPVCVPFVRIDHSYSISRAVDPAVPVICVTYKSGSERTSFLIDGWHRFYRAWRDGLESIPCFVLSEEQSRQVRLA